LQESLVVALLEKYLLSVLAARRDMVEQSGGVNPGMAWHGRNLAELINQGKSDTVEKPKSCERPRVTYRRSGTY
jgi:hypothetical protein